LFPHRIFKVALDNQADFVELEEELRATQARYDCFSKYNIKVALRLKFGPEWLCGES
jgi:hypothetical protein